MRQAGVLRDAAYLIRPDGYIGLADAGASASVIDAYLSENIGPFAGPATVQVN